jgi:lysylphosphatidylglycerol synthetase-like protein (DUF2156 family)
VEREQEALGQFVVQQSKELFQIASAAIIAPALIWAATYATQSCFNPRPLELRYWAEMHVVACAVFGVPLGLLGFVCYRCLRPRMMVVFLAVLLILGLFSGLLFDPGDPSDRNSSSFILD